MGDGNNYEDRLQGRPETARVALPATTRFGFGASRRQSSRRRQVTLPGACYAARAT
jgi:hypothetical protein